MAKNRTPRDPNRLDQASDKLAGHLASLGPGKTEAPSEEAIRRWSAVPLLFASAPPPDHRTGRVVFDAWTHGGVALRDATAGHTRRLTLGSGSILLDLVGWRDEHGWQFTARVRSNDLVSHDFILKTGRRSLLPGSGGYFQWQSIGVPRAIELWSFDTRIAFEPIAWA